MIYRFGVTEVCYGFVDVKADSEEEARDKAYSLDGDYFINKSNIEVDDKPIECRPNEV